MKPGSEVVSMDVCTSLPGSFGKEEGARYKSPLER